jgi:uncharacterized membrane protein YoaK (UPF0700 family)
MDFIEDIEWLSFVLGFISGGFIVVWLKGFGIWPD